MDVEILARIQFAFTIAFHYIYPPLSIGIGLIMVIMEGLYIKTGNKEYEILESVDGLILSADSYTKIINQTTTLTLKKGNGEVSKLNRRAAYEIKPIAKCKHINMFALSNKKNNKINVYKKYSKQ